MSNSYLSELLKAVDNDNDFCKRLMEERMKLDPKKMARALNGKTVEWRKWDALDSVRYGVERYNNYKKGDRVMHERAEFVACGENQQNRIAAIREAFSTLY